MKEKPNTEIAAIAADLRGAGLVGTERQVADEQRAAGAAGDGAAAAIALGHYLHTLG